MRLIRGLGALLVLVAGVAGVPAFLIVLVGNPFPATIEWSELASALTRPDDGSILVGLVTLVAWGAWAVFTLSVVAEVVGHVSGRRVRLRVPGLAGPQRLVSGLVLAVIALAVVTPQPSQATPERPAPKLVPQVPVVATAGVASDRADDASARVASDHSRLAAPHAQQQKADSSQARSRGTTYVVQRGDDLWTLAERFYGEGQRWRVIAAANPDRLTGGPDRLEPGWPLLIPDSGQSRSRTSHVMRRGESLSSVARDVLGDSGRWPELFEANRFQLDDPDEVPVGVRLVVPPADHTVDSASKKSAAKKSGSKESSGIDSKPDREPATSAHDEPSSTDLGEPGVFPPAHAPAAPATSAPSQEGAPTSQSTATSAATTSPADPRRSAADVPEADQHAESAHEAVDPIAAGIAGIGGLLAAALVTAAARRRRLQLQSRPVGRRIPQPPAAARLAETYLGRQQRPLGLRTLDLATRAIAAHCHDTGVELPELLVAEVADDHLTLEMTEPASWAPDGFVVDDTTWRLEASDVDRLRSTPGLTDAVRPYPALVSLGRSTNGAQVVADLEALGITSIDAPDVDLAEAALTALAFELACSPWAEELELILVGTCDRLPDALGQHAVARVDDLGPTLDQLERRAASQRGQQKAASVAAHRVDPDLADPWVPTIMIINRMLSADEEHRVRQLILADPPVSIAAVARELADTPCRLEIGGSFTVPTGRIEPYGLEVTPQVLSGAAADAVLDLVETTGRVDTAPAPWWFDDAESTEPDPPDNVTYLGRRFGGWAGTTRDDHDHDQEGAVMEQIGSQTAAHPLLRLLGPVELEGAAGAPPVRASKQCLEYCAWLLEYPGTTAQAMATALAVAEGTRRSNMSRLRAWLGSDEFSQPYLPDAYSGRILLHPSVSSDWQRLQILTGRGVNRTSTGGLEAALRLVRGAPLADAAPGQWHWAEGLRTDMISVIRDLGVELAERALVDSDIELARWAATRALLVAPGDELLLVARIKTEHRAGNHSEVERLTLQLAAHARNLEVDLRPETVDVLQEMMEGRVRARLA